MNISNMDKLTIRDATDITSIILTYFRSISGIHEDIYIDF